MVKTSLFVSVPAAFALAAAAAAQPMPQRSLITPSQVVTALRARDIATDGLAITIPAQITASVPDAPLEVQSITLTGSWEAQLRMACRNHKDCLPFFAQAVWPAQGGVIALPPDLLPRKSTAPAASKARSAALAAGMPATLEMEQGRIHIRLEVTSLEPGEIGERIRVASRDHKQVYTAEVVSSKLLKGAL